MYYVYILGSEKDRGLYIGYTSNLKRRFKQHNSGQSLSTKDRTPLGLLVYEAFNNAKDAKAREKYLKSGSGRDQLKSKLKITFSEFQRALA